MPQPTALRALAERAGVLSEYVDFRGTRRSTADETRTALLAAMGIEASSEAAAQAALEEWDRDEARRLLPPTMVRRVDEAAARRLRVRVPRELSAKQLEYALLIREESGREHRLEGRLRPPHHGRRARLELPVEPELGYHRLELEIGSGSSAQRAAAPWIICPSTCLTVQEVLGPARRFGLWTHLYAVRSARNWGVGDLTDLGALMRWTAQIGGAFTGVNPLHALRNRGGGISPYSPVSRLFRNPLYLDVTAVPELAESAEARGIIDSDECRTGIAELREADRVDYERVMALKHPVLRALHRSFAARHRGRATRRGRAFARYLDRQGQALTDFATFSALSAQLDGDDRRDWPEEYRNPDSSAVRAFRGERFEQVDYHRFLQFELDRQLAQAAGAADLPLGLYGDLAIGSAPDGSDSWAFPGLFLEGVHAGAPPDAHSQTGQNWGLPPVDPRALQADGYRYWIRLLRNALEHMGALRIDHVMGLFRQYWVPVGQASTQGAYVRYPSRDLLGILALESRRQAAVIVGEDLGTVPRGLPSVLARWGILSSRVLYFERGPRGEFRPARRYSARALVTANTHDHPPLAGYWVGRDLELLQRAGILEGGAALGRAREARQRSRQALLRRLVAEGCLDSANATIEYPELCAAVHAFLARTPAVLLGIWLDDLTGELEPVNLPGTGLDRHANWSRRSGVDLASLPSRPETVLTLPAVSERGGRMG